MSAATPAPALAARVNSIRAAIGNLLPPAEMPAVDATADAMIEPLRWHRRLAGDARKRNRLLAAIYKGA